jgi:hypothetical protein
MRGLVSRELERRRLGYGANTRVRIVYVTACNEISRNPAELYNLTYITKLLGPKNQYKGYGGYGLGLEFFATKLAHPQGEDLC